MRISGQDLRQAVALAAPVMLAYLSIGIPCGVMEAQVGFTPLMAFLFSASYYSGAGQFMIPNMWLAGAPLASIIASVSLVTTRQLLYSTAFAPYLEGEPRGRRLLFAAYVTDETFGVNLDRYQAGDWDSARAIAVNTASVLAWASANALGAALGQVVDLPIDVMSFGMTAIFICLLAGQRWSRTAAVCAAATAVAVVACKMAGLGSTAVFVGALAGIAAGVLADGRRGEVSP